MNLNQLYYFQELADQKQYTKAAENLFISQPTLSVSIKQLETELHCKLFKHNGRYVQLTEYGRIFYDTVTKTLASLEHGKKKIAQKISQDQGNIHIAGIPTAIGIFLPYLTKKYQQESAISPHFIYHDNPSYQICEGIKNGWYDIGICSYVPEFNYLTYIPLYTEEIIAIVAPDNNLAQINRMSPSELQGESIMTYSTKIQIGRDITNALLAVASDLHIINRLHDELAIAGQVLTNDIVGVVAKTIYLSGFDIHQIQLDLPKNIRQVYLVYDPNQHFSAGIIDFIDFIKSNKQEIQTLVDNLAIK
ncbi:DNA-binding transcriptional regulator, LysR family [Lactobacillus bombicola]|uniref:DNA-binding transcriptional regulator, LysR family n=1 Tax=Lactobacillus bombicola TaxID=1505723 RepID=A0A1I1TY05_9LACO|nr:MULTISPECIES: LysR family transcriptional regulator [Lactobacillus]MCO6528414.1 LysR family transcriptional regulator [Lactobacillus sp.]RMC42679.1 LysR family transcriptional regulator [Lactobacillus sp. ESL0233]SFD63482.1 DNA-binding transcriptional regulator, LysR family [Lactobacillus bombicola]